MTWPAPPLCWIRVAPSYVVRRRRPRHRANRCPRYGGPFDSRYSSLTEWRAFYSRLFAKYLLLLSNRRQPQLRDREGDERGVGAQRADLDRGHVGQRPREVFGGLAVGGEKV